MSTSNKSQYVQGLVDFVLDTKPYHSKLTEIIEQYDFYDTVNVTITDKLFSDIELSSVWEKSYVNDGQRTRFLTPSYNLPRYSLEANQHFLNNFSKSSYLLSSYGIDNAYQLRAARGIESVIADNTESLVEGIDYFVSKGMYSIKLNAPSNAVRKYEEPHRQTQSIPLQTWDGSLVVQGDPLHPVNIKHIQFSDHPTFDTFYLDRQVASFSFDTSSSTWIVQHNLNSFNVMWQAYIDGVIPGTYEAILAMQVIVIDENSIEITFGSPHTGKVVIFDTVPEQVYEQAVPSNVWTISHNYNNLNVFVQSLVEIAPNTFEYVIPNETRIIDSNTVELHFTQPQKGKVFLPNLPFGYTQVTTSTVWSIPGNFSDTELSFFALYVEDTGSYVQDFSPDIIVSPSAMTLTFPTPTSGYVSYGYNSFGVTSDAHGFLGHATFVHDVVASVTPYLEQQDFFVPHNPSTVQVNGSSTGFTSVTPGHIRLDYPVHDTTPLIITEVAHRFESPYISFDIETNGTTGNQASIHLREKGITIAPQAEEETWTLIKVNPLSYKQLVSEYVGLARVTIRALKDIPPNFDSVGFDITLPHFDYLRHQYKIEVIGVPSQYLITDISTGQTYTGSGSTFTISDGTDNLFQFDISSSIRPLRLGDVAHFSFGYDVDFYSYPNFNPYDNGITSTPFFGTIVELHPGKETLKLLPLGSAFTKAVPEVISLTYDASGEYFHVVGSATGVHQIAFLGQEYDNGYVRFRLVSSTEVFDIVKMVEDPHNYTRGYSQRSVANLDLQDGDTFHFEILEKRPSYLVHGSVSGYTEPAVVGEYYWNGRIGFQLDAPKYRVQESEVLQSSLLSGGDSYTLQNGTTSILFNDKPKLDAENERLDLFLHNEIQSCPLVDNPNNQFLVFSDTRGQLPAIAVSEPYEVIEDCAERGTERSSIFNLTIDEGNGPLPQNLTVSVVANQFNMCHSSDVLILQKPIVEKLRVNTYREDLLTLELKTFHPELGSYSSELIPTYLVASDDYNVSKGYDGHMLRLGYDIYGNSLTELNYTSPATTLIQNGQLVFNSFNEHNVSYDEYNATFEFEQYDDHIGYGTANDGMFPNKPHKQSPNIPDRAYVYDVFLSNVQYQDEQHHNKVGTITWQADPVDNIFRQVLDVTPHFASNYLKLNTELKIRVEQADEYNDLVRVKIHEQLETLNLDIEWVNVDIAPDVPGGAHHEGHASFDDFSLDIQSDYSMSAYHGYDMYGYDMSDFAVDINDSSTYLLGGYEEDLPDPSDIQVLEVMRQLHNVSDEILYEYPVAKLNLQLENKNTNIELYSNAPSIPGTGNRGYLLQEGLDYVVIDVDVPSKKKHPDSTGSIPLPDIDFISYYKYITLVHPSYFDPIPSCVECEDCKTLHNLTQCNGCPECPSCIECKEELSARMHFQPIQLVITKY